MADSALLALRAGDPVMARLIDGAGSALRPAAQARPRTDDHYGALLRAIVGQQLSTKAARAIWQRLLDYFGGAAPTPAQVMAADVDEMRAAAGLSRAKVSYLRSLAEHVIDGRLELERLDELSDEDVIGELIAVRGIGEWSAHMFLMSHLQRPDVIAPGDLGIRRAIAIAYEMEELPTPSAVLELGERWRPHRTLACRYLWHSLDNAPG